MTRSELIQAMAKRFAHLSATDVSESVSILLDGIAGALQQPARVEIRGFGSFTLRTRAARLGRNPKTGTAVAIPATTAAHFKISKDLLLRINERAAGAAAAADR